MALCMTTKNHLLMTTSISKTWFLQSRLVSFCLVHQALKDIYLYIFAGSSGCSTCWHVEQKLKPTVLIGTSTQGGSFTKEVLEAMAENHKVNHPHFFLHLKVVCKYTHQFLLAVMEECDCYKEVQ